METWREGSRREQRRGEGVRGERGERRDGRERRN